MKKIVFIALSFFVITSCTTKRQITYLKGVKKYAKTDIKKQKTIPEIQPGDILSIKVRSTIPEAALPYNKTPQQTNTAQNIELLQLEGYLVTSDYKINFPVLGTINASGNYLTLEKEITKKLLEGGHLIEPIVSVRLLNGKFTVLGEVSRPGTYKYLEENLNIFQALGYAGDLTIDGKRTDIILIRESDGTRSTSTIDITSKDILDKKEYYIKNNDVIIVNPNFNKVKSAGFIGSPQSIASISSILLSITLLIINQ